MRWLGEDRETAYRQDIEKGIQDEDVNVDCLAIFTKQLSGLTGFPHLFDWFGPYSLALSNATGGKASCNVRVVLASRQSPQDI